ncbi:MAG: ABC transporter substrate-binding protein [Armatimonadota bacterium]|nr:ABC transporter substrate-binding protein [Armatimonadota bacterium]MDR7469593.1 ABC transporter substrate-binding protein [Armatimonadota bacterium]
MRTVIRTSALVLGLALAVGAFAGLAAAQADSRPELRVRLQFARPGGIFDPARWRYTSDWFVYPNLFNWLVRWKPGTGGSQLEPDLAERWTVSADGLTYTFFLRRGVQFHREFGELTADDVVFSVRRQIGDQKMSFSEDFVNVAAVEAVDRYTVRIRLKEPDAAFLSAVLAYRPGLIVSKRAVEQLGEEFAKNPVGTGPFVFERLSGNQVVVGANDRFFRGKPTVRRITFMHIPDELVAATALIKGEFHIIWTRGNPEAVRLLQEASGVKTQRVVVYDSVRHIAMSPNFRPTQDVRVRQALSYAINRQQIAAALPGLELPTDVMRSNRLFGGSLNVPRYPYNPTKARQLLTEAGYAGGFRVRIMYQTRSPEDILANIVQTSWRDVGIDASLEPMEPTAAFDRRNRLDFDVTVTSVGRPADPDLFFSDLFLSTSKPPGGSNYFGYRAADELILAGRREQQREKRRVIYEQLHRKLMTDLPIIPLSNQVFVAAWRDPVVSLVNGTNNNFWAETIVVRH